LALVAGGCGSDDDTGDGSTATTPSTGSPSTGSATTEPDDQDDDGGTMTSDATTSTTAATLTTSTADDGQGTSSPTTGDADQETAALTIGGDGLILVDPGSGSTNRIDFGTPRAVVLAALEPTIGPPDQTMEGNEECGNGQAGVDTWTDAISLDFDADDLLLSWFLRPDSGLTTMAGIGLGSTREELEAAIVVTVEETTLGTEFSAGDGLTGLAGLLDGDGPTAPITELWAGQICAFR
jgi:hypothetical protein